MNSFGTLFRVSIFGESHGPLVGVSIDGVPAGLSLRPEDFSADIERRKGGMQKGTTPRKEDDFPLLQNGVFRQHTTGAPLTILFENKNTRSGDYEKQRAFPRPGHADWVANKKYGAFEDFRGGGHFSGRLTVCLVGAGVVAKKLLKFVGNRSDIEVKATIIEIGGERDMEAGLQKAIDQKDSVGGIVECRVTGLPVGLGEPFWNSVESLIAHAVFAIPAVKGIEFGAGFQAARMFGIDHNDAIENADGRTRTNHAGGIVGGITNGNELVFRIAVKPTSSTPKDQLTLNWETGTQETFSVKGRHDLCIALRVPPVLEAVTAIVLTDLAMQAGMIARVVEEPIYHITTHDAIEAAEKSGTLIAGSLETEGFIHCSEAWQLPGVVERFYKDVPGLRVVQLSPSKLSAKLVYEKAADTDDWFPHVYGPLDRDAVNKVDLL
ncbi:MAG TPA: chorismate synthase [Phnomibacter sp.]|nr:chorismate synthase [Phnomibacter sp.]